MYLYIAERFIRGCCSITAVDPYCKPEYDDDIMIDTDPDIPNRGNKQRIIRCPAGPESDPPCNNDKADFRDPVTTTTYMPATTTTDYGNYKLLFIT